MSSRVATKAALRAVAKHASTNPKRAALRRFKTPRHQYKGSAAPKQPRASPVHAVGRGLPVAAAGLDQKGIAKELAQSISARKAYDASPDAHNAIMGLFNGLGFSDSAIADVLGAAKTSGVTLARLTDADFEKLPDSVPRPRGPSEYFHLTAKDGKKGYVVITSGKPYLIFADA